MNPAVERQSIVLAQTLDIPHFEAAWFRRAETGIERHILLSLQIVPTFKLLLDPPVVLHALAPLHLDAV